MGILAGKVIVLGGVGPGMGRSLAIRAAAEGAQVVLCARTASRLEAIAGEISAAGGVAVPVRSDMSVLADCRRVAQTAIDRFGRIDGVTTMAHIEPDRTLFDDSADDLANWQRINNFILFSTMQMIRECVKGMPSSGGSVAVVGSVSQDQPYPLTAPFAAAKAGLAAVIRVLAKEYGNGHLDRRIRFNMLVAGAVGGEPFDRYTQELADAAGVSFDEQMAQMAAIQPLGYIPPPDEYADALIFLMSDLSKAINGQSIHANGGAFMKP